MANELTEAKQPPVIVIAYVVDGVDGRGLRPEVRELGERVGAELRYMAKPTS